MVTVKQLGDKIFSVLLRAGIQARSQGAGRRASFFSWDISVHHSV